MKKGIIITSALTVLAVAVLTLTACGSAWAVKYNSQSINQLENYYAVNGNWVISAVIEENDDGTSTHSVAGIYYKYNKSLGTVTKNSLKLVGDGSIVDENNISDSQTNWQILRGDESEYILAFGKGYEDPDNYSLVSVSDDTAELEISVTFSNGSTVSTKYKMEDLKNARTEFLKQF